MGWNTTMTEYVITEGEGSWGTWYYHWSRAEKHWEALCGAHTMHTSMKASAWGITGHLNERYCKECEVLRESEIILKHKMTEK